MLDKERLKNEGFLGRDYFEELLEIIREIRASERKFYQKITDIYATALDYDPDSSITKTFFATVQNKMYFAIHGQTASEIIMQRADRQKLYMGLTTWEKAPKGKIQKSDVSIAKNYLNKDKIEALDRIVNMYLLDYAEDQAKRKIPMTMEDWSKKLAPFSNSIREKFLIIRVKYPLKLRKLLLKVNGRNIELSRTDYLNPILIAK